MSWKTVATVMIVIVTLSLTAVVLVGPMTTFFDQINDTGDYDNEYFDGNDLIGSWLGDWLNMVLIGIFGIMIWGFARVVRRELFRGRTQQ